MTSTNSERDPKAIDDSFRLKSGDHIRRYVATDGAEGYDDNPHKAPTLLLITTGQRSGTPHVTPLFFAEDNGRYVIIASKGGDDRQPEWYLNLVAQPIVGVQIREERFSATARTAGAEEKTRLWPLLANDMPFYNTYEEQSRRDIPLVILERRPETRHFPNT